MLHIEHFLEQIQLVQHQLMNHLMHWQEALDHQQLQISCLKFSKKNFFNFLIKNIHTYSGPRLGVGNPLIKSGKPCVGRNCGPYCCT
jgi:hypothetical protein